jgi:hypothetical protein
MVEEATRASKFRRRCREYLMPSLDRIRSANARTGISSSATSSSRRAPSSSPRAAAHLLPIALPRPSSVFSNSPSMSTTSVAPTKRGSRRIRATRRAGACAIATARSSAPGSGSRPGPAGANPRTRTHRGATPQRAPRPRARAHSASSRVSTAWGACPSSARTMKGRARPRRPSRPHSPCAPASRPCAARRCPRWKAHVRVREVVRRCTKPSRAGAGRVLSSAPSPWSRSARSPAPASSGWGCARCAPRSRPRTRPFPRSRLPRSGRPKTTYPPRARIPGASGLEWMTSALSLRPNQSSATTKASASAYLNAPTPAATKPSSTRACPPPRPPVRARRRLARPHRRTDALRPAARARVSRRVLAARRLRASPASRSTSAYGRARLGRRARPNRGRG